MIQRVDKNGTQSPRLAANCDKAQRQLTPAFSFGLPGLPGNLRYLMDDAVLDLRR